MAQEPSRDILLALKLRRLWFEELEGRLEQALPGAGEALSIAWASVGPLGLLSMRIPAVYPVLKPVHGLVRQEIALALRNVSGNSVAHEVRFTAGIDGLPRMPKRTATDVHHPGDPAPLQWPLLATSFRSEVLVSDDPAIQAVYDRIEVAGMSLSQVWLALASEQERQLIGYVPGAASALHDQLSAWQGGPTAVVFVR